MTNRWPEPITQIFINNEFVDTLTSAEIASINPVDESTLGVFQAATEADVNVAVAAAKAAFTPGSEYRTMTGAQRRDMMVRLADIIEAHGEELCRWESLDVGKPITQCRQDLAGVIGSWRYYAGWADKITGSVTENTGDNNMFTYSTREPVGVCGQIIPWNFPMMMQAWKLAPAVCTGCTVVMKSSEKTPVTALMMMDLVREAGFPAGVINLLTGDGVNCGAHIAAHPDVDKVAFTGSSIVGKSILMAAGLSNLKRVTLELGGKSPLIIYDDCDMDQAIEVSSVGLFANGGQCCVASSRIFVQDTIYDEFVARAAAAARARKLGNPLLEDVDQGPQVDKVQYDKVMGYIEQGKAEGATVSAGGGRYGTEGFYIEPTVFSDVQDDMTIAKEEIFGPVMQILKFSSTEEVLERANNTSYGLAAGVCTRDVGRALATAKGLRAGTVWVNCYLVVDPSAPFGGFKESGHGRELGEPGVSSLEAVQMLTEIRLYHACSYHEVEDGNARTGEESLHNYLEVKNTVIPMDPKL